MSSRHFASVGCAAVIVVVLSLGMFAPAQAAFLPGEFVTHSQESWGATPSPGNAAQLLVNNFDFVYSIPGTGVVEVGINGLAGFSMVFTSAAKVGDYLPASGPPAPLNTDLVDPISTSSGVVGGLVLALQLDVDFSDAGVLAGSAGIPYGDLVLHDMVLPGSEDLSELNGLSVRQFLGLANTALGGGGSYDVDELLNATLFLTEAFANGQPSQFAQDHLRVVPEPSAGGVAALAGITALTCRRRRPGGAAA